MAADDVDLRGMIPRRLAEVLDAVASARRIARNELAIEVLQGWADEQLHIAQRVLRVVGTQSVRDGADSAWRSVKGADK